MSKYSEAFIPGANVANAGDLQGSLLENKICGNLGRFNLDCAVSDALCTYTEAYTDAYTITSTTTCANHAKADVKTKERLWKKMRKMIDGVGEREDPAKGKRKYARRERRL